MEDAHRTHKEPVWGWFAVLIAVLDGLPRRKRAAPAARRRAPGVVTPWSNRSPSGWSA
ncbi:MAG: hypothetical protein KKA16_14375 [Alphaproteobacteria bacterium]|nr:hypothetical protein [Alphaproteobacteria bacterium]MBU2378715.1 hypothetical protein [Alphaproteobacteria bacterium]